MDALITDGCSRMSYSALRSLTSLGLKVAVADTSMVGMSQWSRLCKAKFIYAPPMARPETFINDINRILAITGAKFLLPGYDETEVLAKYRDRLPRDVVLPAASYESLSLANDKSRTLAYATGLGIPIPETYPWRSLDELEGTLRKEDVNVVVKLRRGNSAKGVFYPKDIPDTIRICKDLIATFKLGPERLPIIQRRVKGPKWTVSCVYFEGRELSSFTQEMLREKPATGGTSTYRRSVRNEQIEGYTRKLLEGINFHGIVMVEYKYDIEKKDFWFMELNPRLWGAISHAVAAGADFVTLLYIASTRGIEAAKKMVRPYRLGVYSRWLMGDAMLAASEAKRLKIFSALKAVLPGRSEDFDELKLDDPGAFAGEIAYYMSKFLRTGSMAPSSDEGSLG